MLLRTSAGNLVISVAIHYIWHMPLQMTSLSMCRTCTDKQVIPMMTTSGICRSGQLQEITQTCGDCMKQVTNNLHSHCGPMVKISAATTSSSCHSGSDQIFVMIPICEGTDQNSVTECRLISTEFVNAFWSHDFKKVVDVNWLLCELSPHVECILKNRDAHRIFSRRCLLI